MPSAKARFLGWRCWSRRTFVAIARSDRRTIIHLRLCDMTLDDLREIKAFCKQEKCGDAVGGLSRAGQFTKRRLVFRGFRYGLYAKYSCPVCSQTRFFRLSLFWAGHAVERDPDTVGREVRIIVTALIILGLGLWVVSSVKQCYRERKLEKARNERQEAIATLHKITCESFDIKVEQADVFEERELRVLVAATLREKGDETP